MSSITLSQLRWNDKLSEFHAETKQAQEDAAVAKALKRTRYEKPYTFKQ